MPAAATPEERAEAVALAVEHGVTIASEMTGRTQSCIRTWCNAAGATPKALPFGRRRTNVGPCSVAGCEGSASTAGMCPRHYQRQLKAKRAKRPRIAAVPDLTPPTFRSPCHDEPIFDVSDFDITERIARQAGPCPTCGARWRRTITVMPEPTPIRYRKDQTA